jgi:stringent starvation protein B
MDNDMTPYLLVNAQSEGVEVPEQYIEDGKIVLNISPAATQNLELGNSRVDFSARFGGQSRHVVIPTSAVLAIYARENGQGMLFSDEHDGSEPPPDDEPPKPTLKLVK